MVKITLETYFRITYQRFRINTTNRLFQGDGLENDVPLAD